MDRWGAYRVLVGPRRAEVPDRCWDGSLGPTMSVTGCHGAAQSETTLSERTNGRDRSTKE